MGFLSGRIDFFNIDTWNKLKKNWNKASYSNFLDIISFIYSKYNSRFTVGRETTEIVALEKSILLAKMVWVYKVHAMKKSPIG